MFLLIVVVFVDGDGSGVGDGINVGYVGDTDGSNAPVVRVSVGDGGVDLCSFCSLLFLLMVMVVVLVMVLMLAMLVILMGVMLVILVLTCVPFVGAEPAGWQQGEKLQRPAGGDLPPAGRGQGRARVAGGGATRSVDPPALPGRRAQPRSRGLLPHDVEGPRPGEEATFSKQWTGSSVLGPVLESPISLIPG